MNRSERRYFFKCLRKAKKKALTDKIDLENIYPDNGKRYGPGVYKSCEGVMSKRYKDQSKYKPRKEEAHHAPARRRYANKTKHT